MIDNRLVSYGAISTELALLSDVNLSELLEDAIPLGATIGGHTALLKLGSSSIFVKKISLTELEKKPENMLSTANYFQLPLYYQYGIGSTGFGAWRELSTHVMTTNWVITGECPNFPMMYHWRILPSPKPKQTDENLKKIEQDVQQWGGEKNIRTRLLESQSASTNIVLFLEYFPENLGQWFAKEIAKGHKTADAASVMIDNELNIMTSFINAQDLLHFDIHFWNILTDGQRLYLTDFGLATSLRFHLSESEINFFRTHYNYDQCYIAFFFTKWLLIELFGIGTYETVLYDEAILHEYAIGKGKSLPPMIESIVNRNFPIAVVMDKFFKNLRQSKKSVYPLTELELACTTAKQ